jgi:hypothetical protein
LRVFERAADGGRSGMQVERKAQRSTCVVSTRGQQPTNRDVRVVKRVDFADAVRNSKRVKPLPQRVESSKHFGRT